MRPRNRIGALINVAWASGRSRLVVAGSTAHIMQAIGESMPNERTPGIVTQ
jgi:hypothetical protein